MTNKAKHTPAPWSVDLTHVDPIGNEYPLIIGSPAKGYGNTTLAFIQVSKPVGLSLKTAQANARLIATSPELLSALKELFHEVDTDFDENGNPITIGTPSETVLDMVRTTILKAEGKV